MARILVVSRWEKSAALSEHISSRTGHLLKPGLKSWQLSLLFRHFSRKRLEVLTNIIKMCYNDDDLLKAIRINPEEIVLQHLELIMNEVLNLSHSPPNDFLFL